MFVVLFFLILLEMSFFFLFFSPWNGKILVKLASPCVVAPVMMDFSSRHCQNWKAGLRKIISVNGSSLVPENHVRHEKLFLCISIYVLVSWSSIQG